MKYTAEKYQLTFHSPVLTSRGSMAHKNGYLLKANTSNGFTAVGECSYIEGLSIDNLPHYAQKIAEVIATLNASNLTDFLLSTDFLLLQKEFPSIAFGVEMLAANLATQQDFLYFPSPFTQNKLQMPINGLVWMGNKDFMLSQIKDKLKNNFQCIKLKVGALDFDIELELIKYIRSQFDEKTIELRLDANGAFSPTNAAEKLHQLAQYHIHSIEQPIKQNQWAEMATLCQKNIIPIALDEELIGVNDPKLMLELLINVKPQYIILKPSLLGGFKQAEHWISAAKKQNISWWATSALESNYGLNAIAQWVVKFENNLVQGLGTGSLYKDNFDSPLYIKNAKIGYCQ